MLLVLHVLQFADGIVYKVEPIYKCPIYVHMSSKNYDLSIVMAN